MIHVVIATGTEAEIDAVRTQIVQISQGWLPIGVGVWLMGSEHNAQILRDHLSQFTAQIAIIRLQGNWATRGFPRVAEWLQNGQHFF